MRVLQLHNEYRVYGGEDVMLDLERDLLLDRGHEVERFTVSNKGIERASLATGVDTIWSRRSHRQVREVLREARPDILHVHNTFPRLSPSVYWAASSEGVPVVQTLHNYRLACVNGLLLRHGQPCEICVGRSPWPGVKYKCYRDSAAASGAVAAMQIVHRKAGTFRDKVDAYITLTGFGRSVMARSGLPENRIHVKPNFVPDPLAETKYLPEREDKFVFVGRLSMEKGADLLLEAWSRAGIKNTRLVVVGDGPDGEKLRQKYGSLANVEWRGWASKKEVMRELLGARFMVVSSRAYEGFPMVVVEAMSVGTPVIAPDQAGMPEIITPKETGFLFAPNDPADLARKMTEASRSGTQKQREMSEKARSLYLERYTPEVNYEMLIRIYESAKQARRGGS